MNKINTNSDIKLIEELSLNAHPSLKTIFCDGWILRFANGFTGRANSVNIISNLIDENCINMEEKIYFCEQLYKREGLKTIFKITPLNKDFCNLDKVLEQKKYKIITPTKLMTVDFNDIGKFFITAKIEQNFSEEWEINYLQLKNLYATKDEKIARQIHKNIQQKVFTASISQNGKTIACGMCVIEREWVGLYDIFVDSNFRGQGLGFKLCTSLLETARQNGAKKAYLQVLSNNKSAINLYKKIGFTQFYEYWYRESL